MLTDVKHALRVTSNVLDTEITDLIEAAKVDLVISGVNVDKTITVTEDRTPEPTEEEPNPEPVLVEIEVMDPLIKRAITTYCKANFGYDNPEAERFMESYRMLEIHMALSEDYKQVVEDDV